MIKEINIPIAVLFDRKGSIVYQKFLSIGSKRDYKYVTDERLSSFQDLRRIASNKSLATIYKSRYEYRSFEIVENGIVLELDELEPVELIHYFLTLSCFVPTTFGCEHCVNNLKELEENKIQCKFFNKEVKRRKGSCTHFQQRRLFKT